MSFEEGDGGGDTGAGGDNLVGGGGAHHCHQLPSDRFSPPPIIGGDQASYKMLRSVKLSSLKHFSPPPIIGGDQAFLTRNFLLLNTTIKIKLDPLVYLLYNVCREMDTFFFEMFKAAPEMKNESKTLE